MDLVKMNNNERLKLCRKYFYIGFFGLPFLWLVNSVWFGSYIFFNDGNFDSNKKSKRNVVGGASSTNGNNNRASISTTEPTAAGSSTQQPAASASESRPNQTAPNETSEDETKKCIRQIRSYVVFSFLGSMVWTVAIISWIVVFQTKRADWGEFGDKISFNIPRGIP